MSCKKCKTQIGAAETPHKIFSHFLRSGASAISPLSIWAVFHNLFLACSCPTFFCNTIYRDARAVVLQWSPEEHTVKPVSLHSWEKEEGLKAGRTTFPTPSAPSADLQASRDAAAPALCFCYLIRSLMASCTDPEASRLQKTAAASDAAGLRVRVAVGRPSAWVVV